MSEFPNWQKLAVHQRHPNTGCIPTGYEMMLRAAGAQGINFDSFQDEFDLDISGGVPRNHFYSVANLIRQRYTNVEFTTEAFSKGAGHQKLKRLEDLMGQGKLVLVSITNKPSGGLGWHIMPVVDLDQNQLTLLEYVGLDGSPKTKSLSKKDFVDYHDNYYGGDEIAYLLSC